MKKLFVIISCLYLSSCGVLWEYRGLNEFAGFVWHKSDAQTFDVEVSKDGIYDIVVLFRHVQGFPYADMHMDMTVLSDDFTDEQTLTIPIIGEDKEYLGEAGVDIWDVEYIAYESKQLKAGTYPITLTHKMNNEDLQLVMEVGVLVRKSE